MPSFTIEMDIEEFLAYSYFASTKAGSQYIRDMSKLTKDYAVKAGKLTGRALIVSPAKSAAKGALKQTGRLAKGTARGAGRVALGGVKLAARPLANPVYRVPYIGIIAGAAITVYAIGQTDLGQRSRMKELYRTVRG
jgi:hypothetical protein